MTNEQIAAICGFLLAAGTGLVAFLKWAFNAWLADRKEERADRRGEFGALVDIQLTLAAMLERDRIREDRRRRESSNPPNTPRADQDWEGPTTNVHEIKRTLREAQRKTPAGGVRPPRSGSHHDEGK